MWSKFGAYHLFFGFEIRAEARDNRVVGDGIGSRKSKKTTVEEVAVEHDFHFSVRVTVDLLNDENFEH